MMSTDLVLRQSCSGCGSSSDLYGSNCNHMTLCISCGKSMAEKKAKCSDCGATITRLIREYSVRANTGDDKIYFIGKFSTGLPKFSRKKKNSENNWSLCKNKRKDGRRDNLQYLFKEPWVLEDETGKARYQGDFEEQSAAYYLLLKQGKEITAIPSGSWFNFNKVAQYKQLTLEEAEEKMNSRKKTQDGYERWMMKASINGASAFSKVEKFGSKESKNKTGGDDDEGHFSDKGDEDEEEEGARKNRLRLKKKGGDDEGESGDDDLHDDEDDGDSEKGDDWEHEEIFSDDDENNPEETEDFAPEVPAPPELKQDDGEDDNNEEEGGLSKSGKELKKLLGRLNESDTENGDEDEDMDDGIDNSPLKPVPSESARTPPCASKSSKGKRKLNDEGPKAFSSAPPKKMDDDIDDSPLKPVASGSAQTTPSTSKGKRKSNVDTKAPTNAPRKMVKTENDQKPFVKEKLVSGGHVTEEEVRAVLLKQSPITMRDLVNNFPERLRSKEEKEAFTAILRKMLSQKTISKKPKDDGTGFCVVLRDRVN